MNNQELRRHFVYAHPTFGTKSTPKPESAWTKSVYYWWWSYLRRSARYLKTCENPRKGELKELYQSFGDVRGDDFRKWWNEERRGMRLFAEPKAQDLVRIVTSASELSFDDRTLVVSLPLSLPKRYLQRRVRDLLKRHHKGRRGFTEARNSCALFKVRGQPNVPALRTALKVYDFWKSKPKGMPLWEVGQSIRLFQMEHRIKQDEPQAVKVNKKAVLAATVSRYIRRAKESIAATERGEFPY